MNTTPISVSVESDETVDEYALNDESIKFAACFSRIKLQKYDTQICQIHRKLKSRTINGFDFIKELNINRSPFYTSLFRIYVENDSLSWNDFFQFVLFFSLNPTVVLYYFILHALCSCRSGVEWNHLVKLFKLIKRQQAICDDIAQLFRQYDINNDGKISLNQFYNFLSVSFAIFDPINYFRLSLVANVLTFDRIKIILERRSEITNINKYMECNNNQLPPEPCGVKIARIFKGEPHPLKYDYDNRMEEVTFSSILEIYIKKYDNEYVFKQETFAIKYLTAFRLNLYIREIDELYVKIRTNSPDMSRRKSLLTSYKSDLSRISETQTGGRKKSILRNGRVSNSTRRLSGARRLSGTRRLSASGQIYSLTSPANQQNNFPKGNSLSSRNLAISQSSIVPVV